MRIKTIQRLFNWTYGLSADIFFKKYVKDSRNAGAINQSVLQEILSVNSNTIYGKLYNFSGLTPDSFRKQVPLTYYSAYEEYIDQIAAGKENVLTTDPITYFGLSSGTTGKQKRIPITPRTRKNINISMMLIQYGLLRHSLPAARKGGKGLLLMNMLQSGNTSTGIQAGSGTAGGVESMKKVLPYFWTTPMEVLKLPNQEDANYLHLLFALQERDLVYIMAPFASGVVQLLGVLEKRYQELLEDISKGQITERIQLDIPVRLSLENKLKSNPKRAQELEDALKKGIHGIVPRIWPKLSYVTCVTGGSFSVYESKLRDYIGDLPIYSAIYAATEALIGLAPKVNKASYVISPRAAYFEFIPAAEAELRNPATLTLTEVEVGETYEIVVTSYAGFYRYRLGDMIRVLEFYNESPVIEFLYRKGQLLNVAGEKTSEAAVQQAITKTMNTLGVTLEDYTVVLDLESAIGRYLFYLEAAYNHIDQTLKDSLRVQAILEKQLFMTNPRYQAGIESKRISPSIVRFVQPGTFQKIRQELVRRGASLNQVKIPRLTRDSQLIEMLDNHSVRG